MVGGLVLRLIFYTASLPSGGFPFIIDEGNYVDLAVPLSQGMGFVERWVYLRPPGYPIFLALFLVVSDGNLSAAILAQILLSVANIWLAYGLTVEAFTLAAARTIDDGRRTIDHGEASSIATEHRPSSIARPPDKARAAGLLAAGLLAVSPHVVFYANLFMAETLYTFLISLMVWLLLRALRLWNASPQRVIPRRMLVMVALAGVAAGMAVLTRSLLLSFVPLLLGWFWWVSPRPEGVKRRLRLRRDWHARAALPLVLFTVAMFALILPWTARNYLRYDRFLLVDAVGGLNLWQYNDTLSRDEIIERLSQIENPVDRDRYAMQQGRQAILSHPTLFLRDAAERFGDAWPVDYFPEYKVAMQDKYPGSDCLCLDLYAWLATSFYVGFGLLTLWGFIFAPGRTFKGLLLLMLLHYVLTGMLAHVEFRYRLPLYPFAGVYGGWAMLGVIAWLRRDGGAWFTQLRGRKRTLATALASSLSLIFVGQCLLFALPGLPNSLRFQAHYQEGKRRIEQGDYAGALESFTAAERADRGCTALYHYMGLAHGMLGNPDEEHAAYVTAISREPHDWRANALLSDRLRARRDPEFTGPLHATRPELRLRQLAWAWENLSPPSRSEIDVGGDDLGYVMGFESFESEPDAQVTYRWSTSHAYARLSPPEGAGALKLVIRLHSLGWPTPDTEMRVRAGGRDVGTIIAHPAWETVEVDLPEQLDVGDSGSIVIELLVRAVNPPGPETRQLGVAVDFIKLDRADSEVQAPTSTLQRRLFRP